MDRDNRDTSERTIINDIRPNISSVIFTLLRIRERNKISKATDH